MSDIPETKVPIRLTIDGVSEVVSKVQQAQKSINAEWRKSIPEPKIFDVFEEAVKKTGAVAVGAGREIAVNWSAITRETKQATASMREAAAVADQAQKKISYSSIMKTSPSLGLGRGGLSGISKEAEGLSAIVRSMPSIASQLGLNQLGFGVERLRAIAMGLRGMWAAASGVGLAGGAAAAGGLAAALPIAYDIKTMQEIGRLRAGTISSREENNLRVLRDLAKMIDERRKSGELRGASGDQLNSDVVALTARQYSVKTSADIVRGPIGEQIQSEIPELFKRIRELTRESFSTEEASQQQHAKTLLELERIRIESEQEIQRTALEARLKDQNASEADQVAAAESFTQRMRGLSMELADAQRSDLEVREGQLKAELERAGNDPDTIAKVKNSLTQIDDQRTILKAETDAKVETLEAEHVARLESIRSNSEEKRRKAAEKEAADAEKLAEEAERQARQAERDAERARTFRQQQVEAMYAAAGSDWSMSGPQKYAAQSGIVTAGYQQGDLTGAEADAMQNRLGPDPFSVQQQFEASVAQLQTSFGTVAQNIGATFQNVIGTAVNSISDGISGLILRTKTWGQALREIGAAILTSIVQSIVRMGVQWAVGFILQKTLGKAAAKSAIADAASVAASWGPAATAASIATMGSAAGVGLASTMAAMVAGSGFASALSAAPAGSFARGGYTGDGPVAEVAGVVHGREFVFSAPAVDEIGRQNLESIHSSALGRGHSGGVEGMESGGRPINFASFDSRMDATRWSKSQAGEVWFVDMAKKTQHLWRPR